MIEVITSFLIAPWPGCLPLFRHHLLWEVVMDNLLVWPSPHTLASACCGAVCMMPTRVSESNPIRPLLQSHSWLSVFVQTPHHGLICRFFPELSSHHLSRTPGILAPAFKEATLFHASGLFCLCLCYFMFTHLLANSALLPSPDMIISCEAFCSPTHTPAS